MNDTNLRDIQEKMPAFLRDLVELCKKHGLSLVGDRLGVTDYEDSIVEDLFGARAYRFNANDDEHVEEDSDERWERWRQLVAEFYNPKGMTTDEQRNDAP